MWTASLWMSLYFSNKNILKFEWKHLGKKGKTSLNRHNYHLQNCFSEISFQSREFNIFNEYLDNLKIWQM